MYSRLFESMGDKNLENSNVDSFEIYVRNSVYIIEEIPLQQNCQFLKLTGLTRKQIYNNAHAMKNYNKINNILGWSNIWSKQKSIFSIKLCLDQSNDKIF